MSVQRLVSDKIVIRESTGFSYGANVGIGTTVVTATFQVVESGNTDAIRVDNENTTTFVVNTNGNVGIGMSQPGEYRLNVEGAARLRTLYTSNLEIMSAATGPALKVSQTGTQPLAEFIDAETGTALFISNNGNVGIGTTQTGTHSLQVQGSVNAVAGLNVGATSVINASGNIPSADRLPVVTVAKGGTGQTNLTAGKLLVGNATSAVTLPANLHWDSANNRLGVGTATPLQTFNVFGNALIDGTLSASNLVVLGDFTTLNTLTSNTEQMVINNAGSGPALIVRQTGAQPVAEFIDAESGSALMIGNNGNVGIGTVIGFEKLQVEGNVALSGGDRFIGTRTNHRLNLRTNNTDRVTINTSGIIGIGTTLPNSLLEVNGSIWARTNIYINPNDTTARYWFLNNDESAKLNIFWHNGSGALYNNLTFNPNSSACFTYNVGIGTTNPQAPLHVQGAILSTSTNITESVNPPGTVLYVAMSSAPTGYLKCNGAAVSRTTYAALFSAISTTFGAGNGSTTFNVPDLRGEFIRGWDDSRGVDSGRVFGSGQSHNTENHKHRTPFAASATIIRYRADDPFGFEGSLSGVAGNTYEVNTGFTTTGDSFSLTDFMSSSSITGETRPRNCALLACIKY